MDTSYESDEDFYTTETQESLAFSSVSNITNMNTKTLEKISNKLQKEGYIKGKADEESREMQIGFNSGFHHGLAIGQICGEVYFAKRIHKQLLKSNDVNDINEIQNFAIRNSTDLNELLFKSIPESYGSEKSVIQQLVTEICNINNLNETYESNNVNSNSSSKATKTVSIKQSSIQQLTDIMHEMDA